MSSPTVTLESPSPITGDIITSSICPDGTTCGASEDQQCSGGYSCSDDDAVPQTDPGTEYKWPDDAPFPDDPNKVPINCNLPTTNIGRSNTDDVLPLNGDQIKEKTTDAWRVEVDFFPNKPVIIQPKL